MNMKYDENSQNKEEFKSSLMNLKVNLMEYIDLTKENAGKFHSEINKETELLIKDLENALNSILNLIKTRFNVYKENFEKVIYDIINEAKKLEESEKNSFNPDNPDIKGNDLDLLFEKYNEKLEPVIKLMDEIEKTQMQMQIIKKEHCKAKSSFGYFKTTVEEDLKPYNEQISKALKELDSIKAEQELLLSDSKKRNEELKLEYHALSVQYENLKIKVHNKKEKLNEMEIQYEGLVKFVNELNKKIKTLDQLMITKSENIKRFEDILHDKRMSIQSIDEKSPEKIRKETMQEIVLKGKLKMMETNVIHYMDQAEKTFYVYNLEFKKGRKYKEMAALIFVDCDSIQIDNKALITGGYDPIMNSYSDAVVSIDFVNDLSFLKSTNANKIGRAHV